MTYGGWFSLDHSGHKDAIKYLQFSSCGRTICTQTICTIFMLLMLVESKAAGVRHPELRHFTE